MEADSSPAGTKGNPESQLLSIVAKASAKLSRALKAVQANKGAVGSMVAESALREATEAIDSLSETRDQLVQQQQQAAERAQEQFMQFEASFKEACSGRKWRVDGAWPVFMIESGVLVEVDERNRTVNAAGTRTAAIPSVVVSAIDKRIASLIPKAYDLRRFIDDIAGAFDEQKGKNDSVQVLDIYKALVIRSQAPRFWRDARSELFTELNIEQFRARLSRCIETGTLDTKDGRRLRLLPPLNPSDGIFMHLPNEGRFGYIGRIEIVRGA